MKKCTGCGLEKAASEENFYVRRGTWDSQCKPCRREYQNTYRATHREDAVRRAKDWRRRNPERAAALIRGTHLRRMGLSLESFAEKLAAQGGRCAICGTTEPGGRHRQWHVDHDHSCCPGTGSCGRCVRDLLCSTCNQGLGHFKDDPRLLEAAIAYLARHREAMSA